MGTPALLPLRIVDAFLVGASDDPGAENNGLYVMGRHELKGGPADRLVEPDIGLGGVPALDRVAERAQARRSVTTRGRLPPPVYGVVRVSVVMRSQPGSGRRVTPT